MKIFISFLFPNCNLSRVADRGQGGWRGIDPQFNLLGELAGSWEVGGHHVLLGKGLLLDDGGLIEPSYWLVFGQKNSLCKFNAAQKNYHAVQVYCC